MYRPRTQRSIHAPDPASQEFFEWFNKKKVQAVVDSSHSDGAFFVSRQLLQSYFAIDHNAHAISKAMFEAGEPPTDWLDIQERWVQILAILLLIGRGPWLHHFVQMDELCDSHLPYLNRPLRFPDPPADKEFFGDFCKAQWQFIPYQFKPNRHLISLRKELILPIVSKAQIGSGGSATVYRIHIHEDCDILGGTAVHEGQDGSHKVYVLKTYRGKDAVAYYSNEVEAFRRTFCSAIVHCYSSFSQESIHGLTYNVLMEHADCTLEDWFQNVTRPFNVKDNNTFMRNLFEITHGLHSIHNARLAGFEGKGGPKIFQGWHQDIKPNNILVFKPPNGSIFESKFKLADLGLSHFCRTVDGENPTDRDTYGTREYGAPEAHRGNDYLMSSPLNVKQYADIWSLGCVFSESLVWSMRGKSGLAKFRDDRRGETGRLQDFEAHGCFHNAIHVLDVVRDTHDQLLENMGHRDFITSPLLNLIRDCLEADPDSRPTSKMVITRTGNAISDANARIGRGGDKGWPHQQATLNLSSYPPDHRDSPSHLAIRAQTSISPQRPTTLYSPTTYGSPDAALHKSPESIWSVEQSPASPSPLHLENSREDDDVFSIPRQKEKSRQDMRVESLPSLPETTQPFSTRRSRTHHEQSSSLGSIETTSTLPVRDSKRTSSALTSPTQSTPDSRLPRAPSTEDQEPQNPRPAALAEEDLPLPTLAISRVHQWRTASKSKLKRNSTLPNHGLLESLRGRDFVFLIDDSHRMRPYWNQLIEVFHALAYPIKKLDPDGLDMYCMVSMERKHAKHTTDLLEHLKQRGKSLVNDVDINICLSKLLGDYGAQTNGFGGPNRMILYVLTTGVWDTNADAKSPIAELVKRLDQTNRPQKQVGIEFIRFGNDPRGIQKLEQLDDELDLSRDIVDTEPADGNVWKMYLGSVNGRWDGKKSNQEDISMPVRGQG